MKISYRSLSFKFRFFSRKSQSQQKLAKNIIYFTMQLYTKTSLIWQPQLTQHRTKYTPATQPKTHSLYKFSNKHVSVWCQKKAFALHQRTAFSKHWESKCLYISIYLRERMFVPATQEALSGRGLNNFLKAARYLDLVISF